jgi:hypothetical protein
MVVVYLGVIGVDVRLHWGTWDMSLWLKLAAIAIMFGLGLLPGLLLLRGDAPTLPLAF